MMEGLIDQLLEYGPWVVFGLLLLSGVGIPLGEDIIIIPAGMLVQHGDLPFWETLLAAYFGVIGGFKLNKYNNCGSTLVRSGIGPNEGKCIQENQLIEFNIESNKKKLKQLSYQSNTKDNAIKVIEGPQINFFSKETINNFFNKAFKISKSADRMGIRLEGNHIKSKKTSNIDSEGIIKGSVQVPGDGNPIVLMVDHPTIGGYPKIATVILNDIAKLSHLSVGKDIYFEKVSIETAEQLYNANEKYLDKMFQSIKLI